MNPDLYRIVEDNITIRFEPNIYAFSTNTIPSYLKIGDTFRGVDTRISEWKKLLQKRLACDSIELFKRYSHSAKVNDEIYFRDYSVHQYLKSIGKHSLSEIDEELLRLYSDEFYKDTTVEEVQDAINAIVCDAQSDNPHKTYSFYKVADRENADFHYNNDKEWHLRPNQEKVVQNFLSKQDKTELLMYAVMRFGKSFTAMQCALQSDCTKVLIVSAKADVKSEWKKTVEMPVCFKDYSFVCDEDFKQGHTISELLESKPRIAVFLTLQNLTGKCSDGTNIKTRLKQVFEEQFDLIIVDETHYGAWSNTYGRPIQDDEDKEFLTTENKEYSQFINEIGKLHFNKKLHLSGTPYNLLFDKKFDENNIIATCQFKDILEEKERWEEAHFEDIENEVINPETGLPYQEFDNPYFGFPRMLRFAFNLPKSTRELLVSSAKKGERWTLNDLFQTTQNADNQVVAFEHENEILQLLRIIDGAEENNEVLSFLNIPKIKDNDVCKHIVMVLPYKYCCDAMEQLLEREKESFVNLGNYKVLNITGHTLKPELNDVEKVKSVITEAESNGEKTITLTVQKMLTGVTVKEWDTMIMLKNTKSPQEYDQAVFRIQNQYVTEHESADGRLIKIDMKPQTILVDFDPMRMFELQGLSSRVVNEVRNDTVALEESIKEELNFFPIITYNADRLVKVTPTNLVEVITKYNREKSIIDEVSSVALDKSILEDEDIKNYITSQEKNSFTNKQNMDAHTGTEGGFDASGLGGGTSPEVPQVRDGQDGGNTQTGGNSTPSNNKDLQKKYQMCIACLSFYAFLSRSNIESMRDILNSIHAESEEKNRNQRLFTNLRLNENFIEHHISASSRQTSLNINDKLRKANMLSKDESLSVEQRAVNALDRFSRISGSEVVTPQRICRDMINNIGLDEIVDLINNGGKILDIAGKTGEFPFAIYTLLKDRVNHNTLRKAVYTIPTSSITYEFTRLIYEILDFELSNIADKFTSYDLLSTDESGNIDYESLSKVITQSKPFSDIKLYDEVPEGDENVNFDVIIGNPPYQVSDGGAQASAKPIYNNYVELAKTISPKYITLVMPTRWYAGGKGLDDFRKAMFEDTTIQELHDYLHPEEVFPDTNNRGGICYVLWNKEYNNSETPITITNHEGRGKISISNRNLRFRDSDLFLRYGEAISIIEKVVPEGTDTLNNYISAAKAFGFRTFFINDPRFRNTTDGLNDPIKCYGRGNKIGYVERDEIRSHTEWIDKWKVFVPESNNIGTELNDDNQNSFVGTPQTICTETFLVVGAELELTERTAANLSMYLKTKFARFLHSMAKISQHGTAKTYIFVPLQDFTRQWEDADLYAKYNLTEEEIAFIESTIKPMA